MINRKQIFVIGIVGSTIIGILYVSDFSNSCERRYFNTINDIQKYENNLDPEFCEETVDKIFELNDECSYDVETLDCG